MRMVVEIMHLGDQVVRDEATTRIDDTMRQMGFSRIGVHDAPRLRTLPYDIHDLRAGVRPEYLAAKVVELNDNPSQYRVECKLIAEPRH